MSWERGIMSWERDIMSRERDPMSWERDKYFFHMSPQCCRTTRFSQFSRFLGSLFTTWSRIQSDMQLNLKAFG